MNYKLTTGAGDNFSTVSQKALSIATERQLLAEFEFNGIICIVSQNTNLDWLFRDYRNAWTMGWKEVGPDCVENYPAKIQKELQKKEAIEKEKRKKQAEEYAKKEKEEMEDFEKTVQGIEVELSDKASWDEGVKINSDPYGGAVYKYAEGWAKLMQVELRKGKSIKDCAEETSHKMGFMGITGFMYGAAVVVLSKCWKHGEELRKWHNKEYGHEGAGVVNPAVLTINN